MPVVIAVRRHSSWSLWLVACALALRLIVAPGFMPVATPGGLEVKLCGSGARVVLDLPGTPVAPMPETGDCAFAGMGAFAMPVPVVTHLAAPRLDPVAPLLPPYRARPHIGTPAPPPPAIGPPATV